MGITHLKRFIEREAHVPVLKRHREDGFNIGSWVTNSRHERNIGTLTSERIDELNRGSLRAHDESDTNLVYDFIE